MEGESGIEKHLENLCAFLKDQNRVQRLKRETIEIFKQKRELKLIRSLNENHHQIESLADEIDIVFLLAGHDPAKGALGKILKRLLEPSQTKTPNVSLRFCVANFMGYGLYAQNMLTLDDFIERCL